MLGIPMDHLDKAASLLWECAGKKLMISNATNLLLSWQLTPGLALTTFIVNSAHTRMPNLPLKKIVVQEDEPLKNSYSLHYFSIILRFIVLNYLF